MSTMRLKSIPWILLGLAALLPACSARRSEPIAGPLNLASEELRRGEIAFDMHCSHCHPGGERGLAPAINNKPLPGFMIKTQVRHGAGTMPAFSKEELPPEDLDALVKYLKALRRN
jgi:mono/diheme cytochrome c family protein